MNILLTLTSVQLKRAATIKETIAKLEKGVTGILGAPAPAVKVPAAKPLKKRAKMSAAGRARIAAAQKARWAKIKPRRKSD